MKKPTLLTWAGLAIGIALGVFAVAAPSCASKVPSPLTGDPVGTEQARADLEVKARLQEQELKTKQLAAQAEADTLAREREQAARDAAAKQEQVLREAQRVLTRETAKADRARQEAVEALADTFASTVETSGAEADRALRDIQRVYDARVSELTKDFQAAQQLVADQQAKWLAEVEAAEARDAERFAAITTVTSVLGSVATAVGGPAAGGAVDTVGGVVPWLLGLGGIGLYAKKRKEAGENAQLADHAKRQLSIVKRREQELDDALGKVVTSVDVIKTAVDPATWQTIKNNVRKVQGDQVSAIVEGVRNHRKASDVVATKAEDVLGEAA